MAVDFAHKSKRESWTHHPVWGDASWDSFIRDAHNPVHRGSEPMRWPVNGFLFRDPVSSNWYLYVGHYMYGYRCDLTSEPSYATVYKSTDQGHSWTHLGRVLPKEFTFNCHTTMVHAPDVSVVYANGKYHMGFDWAPRSTWDKYGDPQSPADYNGMAYAVADRPEGPFVVCDRPVVATGLNKPVLGRYKRFYAGTLIKRENDWMMVCMADSAGRFSWVLLGMTAKNPEGPWTEPHLLVGPDSDHFHPPLMESYPAFTHNGVLYAPCTSVAANRNFQIMCEAPLEEAHKPEAWRISQSGSMWHGITSEWERMGIWGQTFSGFVDPSDGTFVAMYPSKDSHDNGSINIARRAWNKPYRDHGFFMSAHAAPSLSLLRHEWTYGDIDVKLMHKGICRLVWGYNAPLGANQPTSDSRVHDLSLTSHHGFEIDGKAWTLYASDDHQAPRVVASGHVTAEPKAFTVHVKRTGTTQLVLDGKEVWSGELPVRAGMIGWLLKPVSECEIMQMTISPNPSGGAMNLLYTEALLGGGAGLQSAKSVTDTHFRYGVGALYVENEEGRAKWNFTGRGFKLYSPNLPEGGDVELMLDGKVIGKYRYGGTAKPSSVVFQKDNLTDGPHALVMRSLSGLLVVDSLEVLL